MTSLFIYNYNGQYRKILAFNTTENNVSMRCVPFSDQVVARALCAIMLLEDSSPRQVFTEFLLARKVSQALRQTAASFFHSINICKPRCTFRTEQRVQSFEIKLRPPPICVDGIGTVYLHLCDGQDLNYSFSFAK